MTVPDICPILYDEPQYWYKYWTQFITNKEDVKDKCFYPGMSFQLFKFDRINWVQTPFGMTVTDICPILYDEPQYWYKYWTQFITNKEDVKDECIYPGTKFIYEPFVINLIFDMTGLPLHGRHKIVVTIRAFSWMNVERESSICIELLGEFERLS
ncbi:uncharacterized protein Dmoj_GI24062 [Drosophila mojavensis]|uniref:MD-2-related lipid-recognition domain-containing protein n=1 Tax=Drosophila mojavensis TaxID=7230 RepID=B4KJV5_DROMO|nr:uncharacterized protein Dmoj_GI24062 [Drosophila mojavensis]